MALTVEVLAERMAAAAERCAPTSDAPPCSRSGGEQLEVRVDPEPLMPPPDERRGKSTVSSEGMVFADGVAGCESATCLSLYILSLETVSGQGSLKEYVFVSTSEPDANMAESGWSTAILPV